MIVQNQQLGGRVYTGHAMSLVHKAEHIEGIIHAQVGTFHTFFYLTMELYGG
jgi:hypothetical protein